MLALDRAKGAMSFDRGSAEQRRGENGRGAWCVRARRSRSDTLAWAMSGIAAAATAATPASTAVCGLSQAMASAVTRSSRPTRENRRPSRGNVRSVCSV